MDMSFKFLRDTCPLVCSRKELKMYTQYSRISYTKILLNHNTVVIVPFSSSKYLVYEDSFVTYMLRIFLKLYVLKQM